MLLNELVAEMLRQMAELVQIGELVRGTDRTANAQLVQHIAVLQATLGTALQGLQQQMEHQLQDEVLQEIDEMQEQEIDEVQETQQVQSVQVPEDSDSECEETQAP